MAKCPKCDTPGAYIGFNTIECRNHKCDHFRIDMEEICGCCGQTGHSPSYDNPCPNAKADQAIDSAGAPSPSPSYTGGDAIDLASGGGCGVNPSSISGNCEPGTPGNYAPDYHD